MIRMARRGPIPIRRLLADGHAEPPGPLGPPVVFATLATIVTFVFAYVAYVLFENRFPGEALEIWRRWDTIHYVSIARSGYGTDPEREFLIIWPPLYPWLMRGFRWLTGSYLSAGLFISFVSYLAAIVGLYRLVGLDFPRDVAMRAVIYISIFPAAYFLHAAYTEALFVALVVWSFLSARRGYWGWAGLCAGLASFTRITAFGLLPALCFEYLLQREFRLRRIRADALWLLLIPVGFGLYLWVNQSVYGTPFAFLDMARVRNHKVVSAPWVGAQAVWGSGIGDGARRVLTVGVSEIASGVLTGVLVLYAFVRMRTSYAIYLCISWATFAFTSFWASTTRYILPLFPVFILLSVWGERRTLHWAICMAFGMAYTLLLALFIRGAWAF
jgi:4-amino-4-deoxy-L-arabinose transferase-like glycosyltransferase